VDFLRGRQQAAPAKGPGSGVSSPSGVRGEAPGKCGFGEFRGLNNRAMSTFTVGWPFSAFRVVQKI